MGQKDLNKPGSKRTLFLKLKIKDQFSFTLGDELGVGAQFHDGVSKDQENKESLRNILISDPGH